MEIHEITRREYDLFTTEPFSAFETSAFCELNRDKVDELAYLLFKDGKMRFTAVAGIADGVVRLPFSASFAMFSSVGRQNRIGHYHDAVQAFNAWADGRGCRRTVFAIPPLCYDPTGVALIYNALYTHGYATSVADVSYQYRVAAFSKDYEMSIDPKARQKLRASMKDGLTFERTEDLDTVYDVIRRNRASRGFPLRMTLEAVRATLEIVKADLFLTRDAAGTPVASALIYHLAKGIVRVIYWGNTEESVALRPMNYTAYKVFEHYASTDVRLIDIGQSTENSLPNFGLCDFKQAIGCESCLKFVMTREAGAEGVVG